MPDSVYSADAIIGYTLVGLKDVPVYKSASDYAVPFGFVKKGQPVGVVYSYLAPNPTWNRSVLWWVYKDGTGNFYYSKMEPGLYDISQLQEQGVISVAEQVRQQQLEALPWYERLIKEYGPTLLWGTAGVLVATAVIKGFFSRPRKTT